MTIKDLYAHISVMLDKHGDKHVETVEIVYEEGIEKITVSFKHTLEP